MGKKRCQDEFIDMLRVIGSLTPFIALTVDNDIHPHAVVVATIDNLLKGAATQAIQNMNLACGLDEFAGLAV